MADATCAWCGQPEGAHDSPSSVVGRPAQQGRLCPGTTSSYFTSAKGAPADAEYQRLADERATQTRLAGAMLVWAHSDECRDARVSRDMAEEHAANAAERSRQMKAWRLANGWSE